MKTIKKTLKKVTYIVVLAAIIYAAATIILTTGRTTTYTQPEPDVREKTEAEIIEDKTQEILNSPEFQAEMEHKARGRAYAAYSLDLQEKAQGAIKKAQQHAGDASILEEDAMGEILNRNAQVNGG